MDHNASMKTTLMAAFLALGGCSLAPDYQRPALPVADHWTQSRAEHSLQADPHHGYQAFVTDPQLRRVVDTALGNNRSLRQALLDIEAARAQWRIQRSDRVPSINASAGANRSHLPADLSSTGREAVDSTYQVGLSLPEYELDLFRRVASLTDAALEQYLATREAARGARIALISDTIEAYLNLQSAQRQSLLTRQTLESREASMTLVTQQIANGTATALDFQEARGLVEQARADLESSERLVRQSRNGLVLLIGTPGAAALLPTVPAKSAQILQALAAGSPSQLIAQRPDIMASEHRLKARHADIGAARAAFFPRIALTGSFGTASAEMANLFDGGSRSWSFIPTLSLPIFDGGRHRANLDVAKVRKEAAVAAYEQTVQSAFREVADALDSADTLRREVCARSALANASSEALVLSRARYERGVDSHLRYLEAQRSSFNDQITLIRVQTQQQLAQVSLYRALGGAWY